MYDELGESILVIRIEMPVAVGVDNSRAAERVSFDLLILHKFVHLTFMYSWNI